MYIYIICIYIYIYIYILGVCVKVNDKRRCKCECDLTWAGDDCGIRDLDCPKDCSGHGNCHRPKGKIN